MCWKKIKEGKEVLGGAADVGRGVKEGLPWGTCEQGLGGHEGASHGRSPEQAPSRQREPQVQGSLGVLGMSAD